MGHLQITDILATSCESVLRRAPFSFVTTFVWLQHSNETLWEKAWWKLNKDAVCCFGQSLEVRNKTAAVRPLTFHLSKHPRKVNTACGSLRGSPMDSYTWTHVYWPISKTFIHWFCVDTVCCLEKLPSTFMMNRDCWGETQGNACFRHS